MIWYTQGMHSPKTAAQDHVSYDLLSMYTIEHVDERFMHQYVVDTHVAQTATHDTKPITIVLALVGLFLHIEKGYTGREVQAAHMNLASRNEHWPAVIYPVDRGSITASVVMQQEAGVKRNKMIELWAAAVWFAWRDSHQLIKNFAQSRLGIE